MPFNQKNNPSFFFFFFPTLFKGHAKSNGRITVIEIDKDLKSLSADIISRACFGSNYTQGEEIFLSLRTVEKVMSKKPLGIHGLSTIMT